MCTNVIDYYIFNNQQIIYWVSVDNSVLTYIFLALLVLTNHQACLQSPT